MRALFSIVSLLVVLALVGLLAAKQMKTAVPTLPSAGSPASATGNNRREQSQALQQRVKDDIARAMEQGAASRAEAADQ